MRLKHHLHIKRTQDVFLILITFSLAGSTSALTAKPLLRHLGFQHENGLAGYLCAYLFLMIPLYQLYLLLYGFFLGQFDFFFTRQKKVLGGIKKCLTAILACVLKNFYTT